MQVLDTLRRQAQSCRRLQFSVVNRNLVAIALKSLKHPADGEIARVRFVGTRYAAATSGNLNETKLNVLDASNDDSGGEQLALQTWKSVSASKRKKTRKRGAARIFVGRRFYFVGEQRERFRARTSRARARDGGARSHAKSPQRISSVRIRRSLSPHVGARALRVDASRPRRRLSGQTLDCRNLCERQFFWRLAGDRFRLFRFAGSQFAQKRASSSQNLKANDRSTLPFELAAARQAANWRRVNDGARQRKSVAIGEAPSIRALLDNIRAGSQLRRALLRRPSARFRQVNGDGVG